MAANVTSAAPTEPKIVNRWVQLIAVVIAMMAIANLRFSWTLFIKPLTVRVHASLAAIQVAIAVFIPTQARLVPVEGYILDRLSPRVAGKCGPTLPRYETESALVY